MRPNRNLLTLLACVLVLLLVIACGRDKQEGAATFEGEGTFPVDPLFVRFYNRLGGENTLGPAISPIFEDQGSIYQYTVSALLAYDPEPDAGENLHLAPLGRDLGITEFSDSTIAPGEARPLGDAIDKNIMPLYQKLGGASVVGGLLTKAHINEEKNRYEQYFENVGFFWALDDKQTEPQLLAYGAWKCDRFCRHKTPLDGRISLPTRSAAPFVNQVALHGLEFTGFALTPPYVSADGNLEQVFENLVMQAGMTAPETVYLMQLPEKLGVPRDVLIPADPSGEMYTFPVEGELGYNVPVYFMEYIRKQGGFDFIGAPITQLAELDGKVFRQCFLNMCLRAVRADTGEIQVKPESLGIQYRDVYYQPAITSAPNEQAQDLTLQLWEGFPMVSPEQAQEIGVAVFSSGIPLANIVPELDLLLPDGSRIHQVMPPTSENGESQLLIDPLRVENGSLIPYKVCINTPKGQRFCLMDSYLIWKADFITISPRLSPESTSYLPFVVNNLQTYVPAIIDEFILYLPFLSNDGD